jgi:hypothetical protein
MRRITPPATPEPVMTNRASSSLGDPCVARVDGTGKVPIPTDVVRGDGDVAIRERSLNAAIAAAVAVRDRVVGSGGHLRMPPVKLFDPFGSGQPTLQERGDIEETLARAGVSLNPTLSLRLRQSHAEAGYEHPMVARSSPAHCRGLDLDGCGLTTQSLRMQSAKCAESLIHPMRRLGRNEETAAPTSVRGDRGSHTEPTGAMTTEDRDGGR